MIRRHARNHVWECVAEPVLPGGEQQVVVTGVIHRFESAWGGRGFRDDSEYDLG
jgi:hypothetical protein